MVESPGAELRDTYEKLSAALGAVSEAVAWSNESGELAWCNAAFESLAGASKAQMMGRPLAELLPLYCGAERVGRESHPVSIALQDGIVDTATFDYQAEGKARILELSTRLVWPTEGRRSVVLTIHDITHVHDREHLVFEQRLFLQLLKRVTEASNDADSEEQALHTVLELVCRQTGWPVGHACMSGHGGQCVSRDGIWHGDSSRCEGLREALERDPGVIREMGEAARALARPHFRQSPSAAVASAMAIPVLSGREVVATLVFFSDTAVGCDNDMLHRMAQIGIQLGRVVERKRAENELRQAHAELETRVVERTTELAAANEALQIEVEERRKAEALKDELVATVSHELRTPLSSLLGFTELMLDREFDAGQQREFLEIIHNETLRLTQLINDFLDLQRIESGRMKYSFERLDVGRLLRDAAALYGVDSSHHRFAIEVGADLPAAEADADRIRQVLANLCSNAVKFSPEGGVVRIRARADGGMIEVSVQDEGIGIPAEVIPKLFQKFSRADNADTRRIGGTGLGLALIREIVSAHGGHTWVESTPGVGSTFFFTLPVLV
ncbi:MAG: PAS domain-containing protein [Bryobacterales bacterium]|nr:PAS domain-containing protein [Bryobacterales bacterium]